MDANQVKIEISSKSKDGYAWKKNFKQNVVVMTYTNVALPSLVPSIGELVSNLCCKKPADY